MTFRRPLWMLRRASSRAGLGAGLAMAMLTLLGVPAPARAQLQLIVEDSTASPGGTGAFDVVLTDPLVDSNNNPNTMSFDIGGFSVELSVPPPSGVQFTAADTNTTSAPYIFGTYQSAPAPFANSSFPNNDFVVSDTDFAAPGVILNPGQTVGLEHVSYSVASGTALGPVTVSLVSSGTSLSDNNGGAVAFTHHNGTITVSAAAVPEPSQVLMAGLGGVLTVFAALRSRRRAAAMSPAPTPEG